MESEGIPFVIMDQKIYDCHHGKDRHSAEKEILNKKRCEKVHQLNQLNLE